MESGKEGKTKASFNLSPSSLDVYYQSPLLFYLTHIAKVPEDTSVPVCYGLSGKIVHDCLEKYAKKNLDKEGVWLHLVNGWKKYNLHLHTDIKGNPLNQADYLAAVAEGMKIIDGYEDHISEETITFPFQENEYMKIGIKGIIDLQAKEKGSNEIVIIDYKTSNRIDESKKFRRQAIFYSLLLHKKKNIIPSKTKFHYLKLGAHCDYIFDQADMAEFQEELARVARQLFSFGTVIENYPIGDIDDLFNSRKQACLKEIERRQLFEKLYYSEF